MGQFAFIAYAAALMLAVITAFAILRRTMTAPNAPFWITASPVAFTIALIMTIVFAISLFSTANALQIVTSKAAVAGIASAFLHAVTWSIIRIVIPSKGHDTDHTPDINLDGGNAVPAAA